MSTELRISNEAIRKYANFFIFPPSVTEVNFSSGTQPAQRLLLVQVKDSGVVDFADSDLRGHEMSTQTPHFSTICKEL